MRCSARASITVLLLLILASFCQPQPLTLPALPYDYDALEPIISARTMRAHHLGHHSAYTDNVNRLLVELRGNASSKPLTKLGLDFIIAHVHNNSLPLSDEQRKQLRNQGGGYINHENFFMSLRPPALPTPAAASASSSPAADAAAIPDQQPDASSRILALLTSTFTSFAAFQSAFTASALTVFGSGWAFLILDGQTRGLRIVTTGGQDSPLMEGAGHVVLLPLDLWEHSFYLDHEYRKREYIDAFWKVVNWEEVERRLQDATTGGRGRTRGRQQPPGHADLR
jgi:Fe-Mn family superoxide dismutase